MEESVTPTAVALRCHRPRAPVHTGTALAHHPPPSSISAQSPTQPYITITAIKAFMSDICAPGRSSGCYKVSRELQAGVGTSWTDWRKLPATWSRVWPKEGSPSPIPAHREATARCTGRKKVQPCCSPGCTASSSMAIASTHCHLPPVELYRGKDAWVKRTLSQNISTSLPCTPTFQPGTICQPELHDRLGFKSNQLHCPATSTAEPFSPSSTSDSPFPRGDLHDGATGLSPSSCPAPFPTLARKVLSRSHGVWHVYCIIYELIPVL